MVTCLSLVGDGQTGSNGHRVRRRLDRQGLVYCQDLKSGKASLRPSDNLTISVRLVSFALIVKADRRSQQDGCRGWAAKDCAFGVEWLRLRAKLGGDDANAKNFLGVGGSGGCLGSGWSRGICRRHDNG